MRPLGTFAGMGALLTLVITTMCVTLTPGTALAWDKYGAIAYSAGTGRNGYSYDYDSRAAAQNKALNECGARDCVVKVWFKNACGAFARSRRDGSTGWAYAYSMAAAKREALRQCRARGNGCELVAWACTSR